MHPPYATRGIPCIEAHFSTNEAKRPLDHDRQYTAFIHKDHSLHSQQDGECYATICVFACIQKSQGQSMKLRNVHNIRKMEIEFEKFNNHASFSIFQVKSLKMDHCHKSLIRASTISQIIWSPQFAYNTFSFHIKFSFNSYLSSSRICPILQRAALRYI